VLIRSLTDQLGKILIESKFDSLTFNSLFPLSNPVFPGGNLGGTLSDFINNADVFIPPGYTSLVGGIFNSCHGSIYNSINNGNITASQAASAFAADFALSSISNCINTGKILSVNSGTTASAIKFSASGIVNHIDRYSSSITNCTNIGTVEGYNQVAGILGFAQDLPGTNVSYCSNFGFIKGNDMVGGILGRQNGPNQ